MVPLVAVGYSDGELLGQQTLVYWIGSAGIVQLWLPAAEEVVAGYKGLVGLIDLLEEPSQFVVERFQHL